MIEYNMFKNLTYNSSVPVYAYLMEVTIMKPIRLAAEV